MCMTACEFIKLFPYHLNGMIEHRILSMWLWNRPSNVISTGSFQLRFLNYKVYFAYRDLSHRPFNVWYKKMQNNRHCERHVKLLSAACWFSRRSYWVIDWWLLRMKKKILQNIFHVVVVLYIWLTCFCFISDSCWV